MRKQIKYNRIAKLVCMFFLMFMFCSYLMRKNILNFTTCIKNEIETNTLHITSYPKNNTYVFLNKTFCKPPWYGRHCEKRENTPCSELSNKCFYNNETGVVYVTCEKWKKAQQKELIYWNYGNTVNTSDDRNEGHKISFGEYSSLSKNLGHVLELGCGPFTQSQTVLESKNCSSITLLDPMAFTYMTDINQCFYKNGNFKDLPTTFLSIPAEELDIERQFDTLVMINVIEHVQNALHILQMATNLITENGVFIWHERVWDSYTGVPNVNNRNNIYDFFLHPIRIKSPIVNQVMTLFQPLFVSTDTPELRSRGFKGVYFIGKKKGMKSITTLPQPVSCLNNNKGNQTVVLFTSYSSLIKDIRLAETSSNVKKIILVQTRKMNIKDLHILMKTIKIHIFISVHHFHQWRKEVGYYASPCQLFIPRLTVENLKGDDTICVGLNQTNA